MCVTSGMDTLRTMYSDTVSDDLVFRALSYRYTVLSVCITSGVDTLRSICILSGVIGVYAKMTF